LKRRYRPNPINKSPLLVLVIVLALAATACGPGDARTSDVTDLNLVGVDFELNSIIIENNGSDDVVTDELWIYRDGEAVQLDIFTIEPRSPILFSMRALGDITNVAGEIALTTSDSTDDPEALLAYVAWGDDGFELASVATDAGLWPEGETVATGAETLVLFRTELTGTGPETWSASDEIG
jgi:hypothetical protein